MRLGEKGSGDGACVEEAVEGVERKDVRSVSMVGRACTAAALFFGLEEVRESGGSCTEYCNIVVVVVRVLVLVVLELEDNSLGGLG